MVFTRTSDGATRMATTDTTIDPSGRTLDYSSTDFARTGTFMSHKVITKEKNGQYAGAGTYTTATGDSGTLTTLETKAESVNVVSAIYNSPTTGITNECARGGGRSRPTRRSPFIPMAR